MVAVQMVSTRVRSVTVVFTVPYSVMVRTPVVVIVRGWVTVNVTIPPVLSVEVTVLPASSVEVEPEVLCSVDVDPDDASSEVVVVVEPEEVDPVDIPSEVVSPDEDDDPPEADSEDVDPVLYGTVLSPTISTVLV